MKSDRRKKENALHATTPSAYIVPAVDRAARILSLLRSGGQGMTIAEIGDATGWHKSSVHKLLVTLHFHRLLDRDPVSRRYSLGVALSEYGRIALSGLNVRQAARPFLKILVEQTGETAALSILRESQMTLVDVEESPSQIRVALTVGMSAPATTTSNGKAVLAFLPDGRVSEIIKKEGLPAATRKSITKVGKYRAGLAAVRRLGYATDFEEYQEGISGISAPVFESGGRVIGALSVAGPAFRMTRDRARIYGKECAGLAAELSTMLKE